MRGDPASHRGATVFATHSTHKLLAALSQASYIHIRDGKVLSTIIDSTKPT